MFGVIGAESHAKGEIPVCELLEWNEAEPPQTARLDQLVVRAGAMPPETLLIALASIYPENTTNPILARQLLLADMGLIDRPDPNVPFGLSQIGTLTKTILQLKEGNRKVLETVRAFAKNRKPELLQPITQISLRREFKKSELPAKHIVRIAGRRSQPSALRDWIVIRWHELDSALADLFGSHATRST